MRFVLPICCWLLAQAGQIPSWPPVQPAPSGGGCSQATTFLARTSGLSGTLNSAYTTMICGMVTDGTWSLFDGLYIFATNTTTTANLNLVSTSFGLTTNGSCTFTANTGYTGDGLTCYLDTGFNPTSAGGNFSQNSAMHGVYVLTNSTTSPATEQDDIGADNALTTFNYLIVLFTDGNSYGEINDGGSPNNQATVGNTDGLWIVSVTSSTAVGFYRNGSLLVSNNASTNGVPDETYTILARHRASGSIANYSPHQISAAWVGGGASSTQAGQIASRINAFMTTLGINVY